MTTAKSPLHVLKAQADKMAKQLKSLESGSPAINDPAGKIVAAKKRESITFALVMDDKMLKVEMKWETIRDTTEAGLAEYLLKHMREARDATH